MFFYLIYIYISCLTQYRFVVKRDILIVGREMKENVSIDATYTLQIAYLIISSSSSFSPPPLFLTTKLFCLGRQCVQQHAMTMRQYLKQSTPFPRLPCSQEYACDIIVSLFHYFTKSKEKPIEGDSKKLASRIKSDRYIWH